MERVTCKYCGETKDASLFIKDKKPFRCRKCYSIKYGSGSFDDNEFLAKHHITPKNIKSESKRPKPRYSELQSDVAKYKSLYENSQSQVDTLKRILELLLKDLKVNVDLIESTLKGSGTVATSQYEDFLENDLPDLVRDIMDVIDSVSDED